MLNFTVNKVLKALGFSSSARKQVSNVLSCIMAVVDMGSDVVVCLFWFASNNAFWGTNLALLIIVGNIIAQKLFNNTVKGSPFDTKLMRYAFLFDIGTVVFTYQNWELLSLTTDSKKRKKKKLKQLKQLKKVKEKESENGEAIARVNTEDDNEVEKLKLASLAQTLYSMAKLNEILLESMLCGAFQLYSIVTSNSYDTVLVVSLIMSLARISNGVEKNLADAQKQQSIADTMHDKMEYRRRLSSKNAIGNALDSSITLGKDENVKSQSQTQSPSQEASQSQERKNWDTTQPRFYNPKSGKSGNVSMAQASLHLFEFTLEDLERAAETAEDLDSDKKHNKEHNQNGDKNDDTRRMTLSMAGLSLMNSNSVVPFPQSPQSPENERKDKAMDKLKEYELHNLKVVFNARQGSIEVIDEIENENETESNENGNNDNGNKENENEANKDGAVHRRQTTVVNYEYKPKYFKLYEIASKVFVGADVVVRVLSKSLYAGVFVPAWPYAAISFLLGLLTLYYGIMSYIYRHESNKKWYNLILASVVASVSFLGETPDFLHTALSKLIVGAQKRLFFSYFVSLLLFIGWIVASLTIERLDGYCMDSLSDGIQSRVFYANCQLCQDTLGQPQCLSSQFDNAYGNCTTYHDFDATERQECAYNIALDDDIVCGQDSSMTKCYIINPMQVKTSDRWIAVFITSFIIVIASMFIVIWADKELLIMKKINTDVATHLKTAHQTHVTLQKQSQNDKTTIATTTTPSP